MSNRIINSIVECMAVPENQSNVQSIQTEHRLKLAEFWGIKKGSRVLEVGCGQGDTTAVLAYLVGETGFVHGVDIASPFYGAPITLGQAAQHLKRSKLGKQVQMDFELDLLSPEVDFPKNHFDVVVLSHCSWYFKSHQEFEALLKKVRKWAKQLCYAEWDPRITEMGQLSHLLSVLIQAQYECYKETSLSNVRTLMVPSDLKRLLELTGWEVISEETFHSPDLQDGQWEFNATVMGYQSELDTVKHAPDKFKKLIQSEVSLLEHATKLHSVKPMGTYGFVAR